MATYSTLPLSGSVSGAPVLVAANSTPGTIVHTSSSTAMDRLFLTVTNTSSSPVTITIEKGGVTDPNNLVVDAYEIEAGGFPWELPPMQLTGGLIVRAFASSANVMLIDGFVNRWDG